MSSVTIVRSIDAASETVFDAITTSEGIAQWWGPDEGPVLHAAFDARVGGRFTVRFRMMDGTEHECSGEVREIVRSTRLRMSWRWHGDEAEGESEVDVSLRAIGSRCELTFVHRLLPDDAATADGHEKGWNGSLDKLERRLHAMKKDPSMTDGAPARPAG